MSLRDALLKAGKVSKKDAQQARTEARKKRKKKKGHVIEAEQRDAAIERDAARRAERDAENRARAEQERQARVAHERDAQIRNLIQAWTRRPNPKARRVWHFVRSNGHIGRTTVDQRIAAELEFGSAAIVELPSDRSEVRIVAVEGVRKLAGLYGEGIRFFLGDGGPSDPLVRPAPYPRRPTEE